ncbi:uncharacterized protein LOC117304015 [Asterias rubens]|uniref:uncharacterized protein LOC117304015 n=1 Tax=Asterias rubens TaxID=7604 RepID=UPI001455B194|nr:uncharacterized protein LOC117304015 [Asterias rubens]
MALLTASWRLLLILIFVTIVNALSDDEIAMFQCDNHVEGNTGVSGTVAIATEGEFHIITSNGVPDHKTAEFPNNDNPNDVTEQTIQWTIPVNPVAGATTSLPMGPIGVAINGIPFFSPYTSDGLDAVETEVFDDCDGHPTQTGAYHYHKMPSSCVFDVIEGQPSSVIGVAFDGFLIYGPNDENGVTLTSGDLNDCHGRIVDGKYRYHATSDFPYTIGC